MTGSTMTMATANNKDRYLRWQILLICFLTQNIAMGFTFGSFGALLQSSEEHFGITRAFASVGMSLVTLAIGGLSPFVGNILQYSSIRTVMIGGAAIGGVAYLGLALSNIYQVALLFYALIGLAVSILAILGPLTLVANWFSSNRAKTLSIVNLPLALFLTPYLVSEFLPLHGRFTILAFAAVLFFLLIPLLFLIKDKPTASQSQDSANAVSDTAHATPHDDVLSIKAILKLPEFWLVSLGIGLMAGVGTVFVVHIVAFGVMKGMPLQSASLLMSLYAASGILGLMIFPPLADRIGSAKALISTAICQTLLFTGLLTVDGTPFFILAALFGMCSIPMVTLHGAVLSEIFTAKNISKAMGYSYSLKLPFLFFLPPVVGFLYDYNGNYTVAFFASSTLLLTAAILFLILSRKMQKTA